MGYQKEGKFENCVQLALVCFNDFFDYTIRDLLSLFPKDAKDKEGAPFWSGPKRCPTPITFDPSKKEHITFVLTYANLIAAALKIAENRDEGAVTQMVKACSVPAYVPKKIEVKLPGEEEGNNQQQAQPEPLGEDDEKVIDSLIQEIETLASSLKKDDFQPAEFEKDDDSNFHIDFINATSNLRATNYEIKNCDR